MEHNDLNYNTGPSYEHHCLLCNKPFKSQHELLKVCPVCLQENGVLDVLEERVDKMTKRHLQVVGDVEELLTKVKTTELNNIKLRKQILWLLATNLVVFILHILFFEMQK